MSDTPADATAAYFAATADGPFDHQRDAYEAGYEAGRAEEREACARLAEIEADDCGGQVIAAGVARHIAALIRARTTP